MAHKRSIGGAITAAVLVLSGCSGGEPPTALTDASEVCGEGESYVEELGECRVPLTAPPTSSTTAPTTTSTTTTMPEAVATPAESEASTTDEAVLTWAQEGTVEADIEQAFWKANEAGRGVYAQTPLDPDWEPFTSTHTGRELERIQTDIVEDDIPNQKTFRYPEPTDTLIEFITLVTPTEALMQVCELTRSEYYIAGELVDDRDGDSQFQARFVLVDDVWLWEERIKLKFAPLEGDTPTCMSAT